MRQSRVTGRRVAVIGFAVLMLAGCGSAAPSPAPTAAVAPTSTVSPTPELTPELTPQPTTTPADVTTFAATPPLTTKPTSTHTVLPTARPAEPTPEPTALGAPGAPDAPTGLSAEWAYPDPTCGDDPPDDPYFVCGTIHFHWTKPPGLISGYYLYEADHAVTAHWTPTCDGYGTELSASATEYALPRLYGSDPGASQFFMCAYNSAGVSPVAMFGPV